MENLYEFFDDIVCINLSDSKDRKIHSENIFKTFGIPARFFTVDKHANGGLYGCFDSHIQIIQYAYNNGLNNILVFEDDFEPSESYSREKLSKAIEFMSISEQWDIFYLGYSFCFESFNSGTTTVLSGKRISNDIVQYNAGTTHALCYSRRSMEKILKTYHDYIGIIHYDQYLSDYIDLENYCILPIIFQQNLSFSYNIEGQHGLEMINRMLYPIDSYINFNYNASKLHYDLSTTTKYSRYYKYIFLILTSIILHIIKKSILKNISI